MKRSRRKSDDDDVDRRRASKKKATTESSKKQKSDRHRRSTAIKKSLISSSIKHLESVNITQKRLTQRFGVYATGKGSSRVWREYCDRRENRARANEDLSEIIKLAADGSRTASKFRRKPEVVSISPDDVEHDVSQLDFNRANRGGIKAGVTTPKVIPREIGFSSLKRPRGQRIDVASTPCKIPNGPNMSSSSSKRSSENGISSSELSVMSSETNSTSSTIEEEIIEEVDREVRSVLNRDMDTLFSGDDDYFEKTCDYLQKMHTMSRGNSSVKSQNSLENSYSLSQPSLILERHNKVNASQPVKDDSPPFWQRLKMSVEKTNFFQPKTFLPPENVQVGGNTQRRDDGPPIDRRELVIQQRALVDKTVTINRVEPRTSCPNARALIQQPCAEQVRRLNDCRHVLQVTPKKISWPPPVSSFPSRSAQNRRQMLLRLQDPNDKDILDYMDTIKFNTPQTTIGLTEGTPDSDGVPIFLPQLMPSVRLSVLSRPKAVVGDNTTPHYFRHKLY